MSDRINRFTVNMRERRTAFYDFAVSPTSYDFATFVSAAKAFSKQLHVVFVPGNVNGFRLDHKPISVEERGFRIMHILGPLCTAIGATFTVCHTREDARKFYDDEHWPLGYTIEEPKQLHTIALPIQFAKQGIPLPSFAPTMRAMEMVSGMFDVAPIVITLRECYLESRNSDVAEWVKFYHRMKKERPVIFVRDTDKLLEPFDAPVCQAASLDVDLRLALYQIAHVNMGVTNGPMVLNIFSERPYLIYRYWNDQYPETSRMLEKWGLPRGTQYSWATAKQRLIWEQDDLGTLLRTYHEWSQVREQVAA